MKIAKSTVFGLVLAGAVTAAVSSLVAQAPAPRPEAPGERRWSAPLVLEGRGARIGVTVEELDAAAAKAAGGGGVRIGEVDAGGPAARADLRAGDIVVELDGDRVRGARQFARMIQESPDGRPVTLGVMRGGERLALQVTPEANAWTFGPAGELAGREIEREMRAIEPRLRELEPRLREFHFDFDMPDLDFDLHPRRSGQRGRLGVQVNDLTPQLADYFGASSGGVLVTAVTEDSPAAQAGLKAGDVITSIDGEPVRTSEALVDELRDRDGQVTVGILRDKRDTTVAVTLEPPRTPRSRPVVRRPA